MYSAGYVHRDLSVGNILWCEDGQARITDLEYAREFEVMPNANEGQTRPRLAHALCKEYKTVSIASSLASLENIG